MINPSQIISLLCLTLVLLIQCKGTDGETALKGYELKPISFEYKDVAGIGIEEGITRRDPSDIIKVNDTYYVYYTKVIGRAPGYWGNLWYASSTDEGFTWVERGLILDIGEDGAFDSQAVFTPNILMANNQYFLFYTGVKPTPGRDDGVFENNSTTDITGIGLAVSESPDGPFTRLSMDPIMQVSEEPDKFDSYRIDDASLMFRDAKYLLYYKGRSRTDGASGPRHTQMGVAIADNPEGPYQKHPTPLLDGSHEVLIWQQGEGVGCLASLSSTLEYSATGFDFTTDKKGISVKERPSAPGAFRADLTGGESNELSWGISMVHNGSSPYLIRYEAKVIKQ